LERVEGDIGYQRGLAEKAEALEARMAELKLLEKVFKDFQQSLTDRIRPALAARAGNLLHRTTAGRYARVELDDNYDIRVFDGTESFPLSRFSGGESDLINLCLRIAISQVVANRGAGRVNLLVLDEVFGSQDAQRKDGVLRALQQLSGDFHQVFVITHDDFVKDRMDSVLEVVRGDDGRSSVVAADGA
jgi:exonuclease SbcC